MNRIILSLIVILLCSFSACLVMENTYTVIPPGKWRGILQLSEKVPFENKKGEPLPELVDIQMEEITEGELPFIMEVVYTSETDFYIDIINGAERVRLDEIETGHDKKTGNDTLFINIPEYDTYIRADYDPRVIAGNYYVPAKGNNYKIPFIARYGKDHRFTLLRKEPFMNISGNWEVQFGLDGEDPWPAIGEFKQEGNHLTGTFITETGDYRFLEGTVQANKVYLSTFDGAHAFLFEAKILEDSTMIGTFRSGTHYSTTWKAKRNPNFSLRNPDELTFLKDGFQKMDFEFKNPEGKIVSLADKKYEGKVKLVQIFGTWCPNCRDETEFLIDYFKKNPSDQVEIIALAFERYKDSEKANAILQQYKRKMKVPYEMVYAGYANKAEAAQALPMLNKIVSYPTLIFIDKNDKVRKIHTGFNGPATSKYKDFTQEFHQFLDTLLQE